MGPGIIQPAVQWLLGLFCGPKAVGARTVHPPPPPSVAEVKNESSYTFASSLDLRGLLRGTDV
jgi:hypothetical protein